MHMFFFQTTTLFYHLSGSELVRRQDQIWQILCDIQLLNLNSGGPENDKENDIVK